MTAVTVLKTAPSFLLLNRGDNPATVEWTPGDRALFVAVVALESEKCPQCGVPTWHGGSAHEAIEFELTWQVCYGCQAKDELTKDVKVDAGVYSSIKAIPAEGEDRLPSRSEGYAKIAHPLESTNTYE